MRVFAFLLILAAAGAASARDETGRLSLIVTPNNAQPAVLQPGGAIEALLRENVPLRIESAEGSVPLEFLSARPWRGRWVITSRIPASARPGAYTLIAERAERSDAAYRSVYVLPERPDTYRIAHVSNLRVGDSTRADSQLFRLTDALNDGAPDLILITGDLTAGGTEDQFRIALDVLNDCRAPTLVAPGDADDAEGLLEAYLGEFPAALRYGPDGYLLCPPPSRVSQGNEARLHIQRRAIRAARWSVGAVAATSRQDLRAALSLLVDDPLDFVFEATTVERAVPAIAWGRTKSYAAAGDRQITWFTVSPPGIVRAETATE